MSKGSIVGNRPPDVNYEVVKARLAKYTESLKNCDLRPKIVMDSRPETIASGIMSFRIEMELVPRDKSAL